MSLNCPQCGSTKIKSNSAFYLTHSCSECGYSWGTVPSSLDNEDKNLRTKQDSNVTVEASK